MRKKLNNQYFILRHGQTLWQTKEKKIIYSWPDVPPVKLTEKGQKQIKIAAKKLKKYHLDLIYSSDIYRTRQSSDIVAKDLNLKIKLDKRLRDINLGVYHGRLKKDFYQDFRLSIKRFSQKPKRGESWNDVKKRLLAFLKEIEKKHKKKKILVVSHGDPLWLFEGLVKRWPNERLIREALKGNYIKVGELRKI